MQGDDSMVRQESRRASALEAAAAERQQQEEVSGVYTDDFVRQARSVKAGPSSQLFSKHVGDVS